jgi:protein SCO1/2
LVSDPGRRHGGFKGVRAVCCRVFALLWLAAAAEQPSAAQMMDDLMYGRGQVGGPFTLTDQTGKQRSDTDFRAS